VTRGAHAAVVALAALAVAGLSAACSPKRDVVAGGGRDVLGADGGADPARAAYDYVAKRPHGVVALAEARRLSDAEARQIVDHLADALDGCARDLEQRGTLVEGAARVIMIAGPRGNVEGFKVTLTPGNEVAANALLCVVAPARAVLFPPPSAAGAPAMAIEITWGPSGAPAPAAAP
jgi:hypothetical protein